MDFVPTIHKVNILTRIVDMYSFVFILKYVKLVYYSPIYIFILCFQALTLYSLHLEYLCFKLALGSIVFIIYDTMHLVIDRLHKRPLSGIPMK